MFGRRCTTRCAERRRLEVPEVVVRHADVRVRCIDRVALTGHLTQEVEEDTYPPPVPGALDNVRTERDLSTTRIEVGEQRVLWSERGKRLADHHLEAFGDEVVKELPDRSKSAVLSTCVKRLQVVLWLHAVGE